MRSRLEAERPSVPAEEKETEARERWRPLSLRERLEKEGWRPREKLLTDMLEDMLLGSGCLGDGMGESFNCVIYCRTYNAFCCCIFHIFTFVQYCICLSFLSC